MSLMPPKKAISSDIFKTPEYAVDYLLPYIPKEWRLWECADDNKGKIYQKLIKENYDVVGTDILNGFDFLAPIAPVPEFDCILTNPPYSLKDDWLQRCYDLDKPFALLLPITALGEQGRLKMYKKYGIKLLLPPERINFETPSGEGSGAWFYCAWFCWKIDLPDSLTFYKSLSRKSNRLAVDVGLRTRSCARSNIGFRVVLGNVMPTKWQF